MKFLLIILIFTGLYADDHKYDNERHLNKELSHLSLSKQQNINIKRVLKNFRFDLKEYREYKEEIEAKRESLFIQDVFDIEKLNELNIALDARSHEIENRLLKSMHSILSQKQRREFIYYFDDWEVE
ncbi:MAG: hypothetical protein L3J19_07115 [Sulfurimonas sp.]|nr:hypothetical protein [Sulfurimonas sp.]